MTNFFSKLLKEDESHLLLESGGFILLEQSFVYPYNKKVQPYTDKESVYAKRINPYSGKTDVYSIRRSPYLEITK